MLRSSTAIAPRMLRLVAAASSRQSILCHRVIAASPESPNCNLSFTFDSFLSRFPSIAEQSRGFACGQRFSEEDNDEDEDEDEDEDDMEFYDDDFDPDMEGTYSGEGDCASDADEYVDDEPKKKK